MYEISKVQKSSNVLAFLYSQFAFTSNPQTSTSRCMWNDCGKILYCYMHVSKQRQAFTIHFTPFPHMTMFRLCTAGNRVKFQTDMIN